MKTVCHNPFSGAWVSAFLVLLIPLFLTGCGAQKSDSADESPTADSSGWADEGEPVADTIASAPGARRHKKAMAKPKSNANYSVVKTFFATDRNHKPGEDVDERFGSERSELKYGTCEVSIPRDHRMGELEAPSIWRLEFRENPEKHVVLLEANLLSNSLFFDSLSLRVGLSTLKSAFVFVHGYNVSFEDAARRTAQISYDLGFDGAPVFYSWPSRGKTKSYIIDEQMIEWSQANMKQFLADFFDKSDAQNVYLIAHSMGNRALTRSLAALLQDKPEIKSRLKEIILTAPDIDAEVFKRDIAPNIISSGRPVTLYASSKDIALKASKAVHGGPRAGDSGNDLVIIAGMETVDATEVETSFLGHSYYADSRSVLGDLFYLIHDGKRAKDRFGLLPVTSQRGMYWVFKP